MAVLLCKLEPKLKNAIPSAGNISKRIDVIWFYRCVIRH